MVNNQVILEEAFNQTTNSASTGLVSHKLSTPIVIENQDITTSLIYNTDMIGTNDTVRLLGEAVVAPPTPTGTVSAPTLVATGGSPTLNWSITKSPSSEVVVVEIPTTTNKNGSGADQERTNHGHGNNVDDIDRSNPGKAPFRWNDTDSTHDDEASTSVSQTKASKN